MVNFKGLAAKARQLAQRNPDKVDKVLDQAGSFVDKRTGRKYERHVDTVQQKARQFLGGDRAPGGPGSGDRAAGGPTPGERLDGRPGAPGTGAAGNVPGGAAGHVPGDVPGDRPGDVPGDRTGDRPGGVPGDRPGHEEQGPDPRP
ncbi:Rv0909 family putative TA system antitoxin [Kocuria sp. CPCC 205268]|uniref:antitoxin n=1 Tax=Kocuria oxytropis TaxID=3058913 RepID=UPI0034D6F8C3